ERISSPVHLDARDGKPAHYRSMAVRRIAAFDELPVAADQAARRMGFDTELSYAFANPYLRHVAEIRAEVVSDVDVAGRPVHHLVLVIPLHIRSVPGQVTAVPFRCDLRPLRCLRIAPENLALQPVQVTESPQEVRPEHAVVTVGAVELIAVGEERSHIGPADRVADACDGVAGLKILRRQ